MRGFLVSPSLSVWFGFELSLSLVSLRPLRPEINRFTLDIQHKEQGREKEAPILSVPLNGLSFSAYSSSMLSGLFLNHPLD